MVKTRRSLNDEEVEEENSDHNPAEDSTEEKTEKEWPKNKKLKGQSYRVGRKLQHWPNKLSRRLRTIKMPRIVFPESDTEPEKYSRRNRRPLRVYFADDPAQKRSRSGRVIRPKNYMEDSGDKPIQQNVRRSGRQRKLLHLNFNESWITNELQVKGYPGLYGQFGQSSSSSESSSDERTPRKRIPTSSNRPVAHTDEDTQQNGERMRRTSARFRAEKKLLLDQSDSEMDRPIAHAKKTIEVVTNGDASECEKDKIKEEENDAIKTEEQNETRAQDSESNQAGGYRLRRSRQRIARNKKEDDNESGSDSVSSESDELLRQPRRSNRTRKPTILQISDAPRQVKSFTLRKKRYSLRQREPPKMRRRNRSDSDSSSSSTDSEEINVKNTKKGRQKTKTTQEFTERALREIQPVQMDGSITFASVGGLEEHIRCMRETVLFPLMYPALYQKFNLIGSRGILLHGPPGSGKTLLARALASECTRLSGRKVSFFMRKGADCLRKWVGESERLIKLLFQQARTMKPSIIFFDEIDALAPVRTGRQDQVHTSVVGTLLAEMDGLCDRGEVVVIGATNRVDAVDPALRRPGRFDRELYFPAPNADARLQILSIHTSKWSQRPDPNVLSKIADVTHGYAGADLKALCSEAIMRALRRIYPQVYVSDDALLIDTNRVEVSETDWLAARHAISPSGSRAAPLPSRPLSPALVPLLQAQLHDALALLHDIYGHIRSPNYPCASGGVLLVKGGGADNIVAPALVHQLDHATVKELSPYTLQNNEQQILATLSECRRAESGSLLWLRHGDLWQRQDAGLLANLWRAGVAGHTCLLLISSKTEDLHEEFKTLFNNYSENIYSIRDPTTTEVINYLKPLIEMACQPPPVESKEFLPELPKAPPPPPPRPSPSELARRKRVEDYKLRELRIFLRDVCRKLAANRRFYKFTKPVDLEEVTDYLDIVKQPMDLETMMTKVDLHQYNCAREFLEDIDLICANALEYNPDRTSSDKQIRHEACSLRDHAHALIDVEMDSDFELQCQDISRRRKLEGNEDNDLPSFIYTANHANLLQNGGPKMTPEDIYGDSPAANGESSRHRRKRRRVSAWSKGKDVKKQKHSRKTPDKEENSIPAITDEESKENKPLSTLTNKQSSTLSPTKSVGHDADGSQTMQEEPHNVSAYSERDFELHHETTKEKMNTSGGSSSGKKRRHNSGHDTSAATSDSDPKVVINKTELESALLRHAKSLRSLGVEALVALYTAISRAVHSRSKLSDRTDLPRRVASIVDGALQHRTNKK